MIVWLLVAFAAEPAPCEEPAACAAEARALGFVDGRPSAEAPDPAAALDGLEQACAKGHLPACVDRARMVQRGVGTAADPAAAADAFRAACDRGEPSGCLHLSKAHQLGLGVPSDAAAVRARAEQACVPGFPQGCNALALSLHLGTGGDKDHARAWELYGTACAEGFAPACDNLDRLYEAGMVDAEGRQAKLAAGCDAGSMSACAWLGDVRLEADPEAAVVAYRQACDAKLARGCRGVALAVLDAVVEGDTDEAFELLRGACDVGEPAACARLGDELASGKRLGRDWLGAYEARELACRGEHGPACFEAAWQRRKGRGPDKDKVAAEELAARACVLGVAEACP